MSERKERFTPEPWKAYKKGEVFATLESRKGAWELRMPFDGRCFGESRLAAETEEE